ncbi:MAG TPA: alpha-L-fucosidase [Armatimonadota bacterium]|jgi:alpha-L-fucosidase
MKCCWKTLLPIALAVALTGTALAAKPAAGIADRTKWWRDARFGMFIHWGLYAIPADGEWRMYEHKQSPQDYEKYAAQFNPVNFNARKWVKAAKDAGMKYIVITSRHHDGFSMFDTKLTNYSIVRATPFARDPMKDLAAECKRQGIRFCFYHTIMDWHNPDYLPRREWEKESRPVDGASLDRYIRGFLEPQIRELLTNYGPIGGIWFDGGWEHSAEELHSQEILDLIHSLQPATLVNDRTNLPADYATPEQTIPANGYPGGRLWETCMTMNDHWGYARDDHNWKSPEDLVRKLSDIASKGGNFLLNVGPNELGEFPPDATERLAAVGQWMKVNGDAIYGTSRSPFKRLSFDGRCTRKGNRLYLHVFNWPADGLRVEGLKTPVVSARALDGKQRLTISDAEGVISISRPARIDPIATVVELRLSGEPVVDQDVAATPDANGRLSLTAQYADVVGASARLEQRGGQPNIGYWTDAKDAVEWVVKTPAAGAYTVEIEYACPPESAGSTFTVGSPDSKEGVKGTVASTGDWEAFRTAKLDGALNLPAGRCVVRVTPIDMPRGAVMNLRSVTLTPQP